jgi:ADP-ribose pyrophosphatase YjhB (NUDIX family)
MAKTLPMLDPVLRARWAEQTQLAPASPRLPLRWQGHVVGSVAESMVSVLASSGLALQWQASQERGGLCWHLPADPALTFAGIREFLHRSGVLVWPSVERLPVWGSAGQELGWVPRDLVRYLGVDTHSVHVVGWQGDVSWVQERANNKTEDPGLWDTLIGGTVGWEENPSQTLEREAWEEAGLSLRQLQSLTSLGAINIQRPMPDPEGWAYQVETIHCLSAQLPPGVRPLNQDGEVAAFHPLKAEELNHALESGRFTLAATGVYLRATGSIADASKVNL